MKPETHIAEDSELVRETLAGSFDAYEELVRRYERRLYAFLRTCCRNDADARELTQETFVKAFQALPRFRPARSFPGWLFAIARNASIDRFRAAPPAPPEPPEAPDRTAGGPDPAEALQRSESALAVWNWARSLLPEKQFQALWFRYIEDMDVAGIARVLGITRIHAKVLLFRGRQALGRALRQLAQGGDLREAWDQVLSAAPAPPPPAVIHPAPLRKGAILRQEAPGGTL